MNNSFSIAHHCQHLADESRNAARGVYTNALGLPHLDVSTWQLITMAYEKGVKAAQLDVDTKVLTVVYQPEKTSPDKIRRAVANAGYDADSVLAEPRAYQRLPDCCQKTAAPHKD